MQNPTSSGDKSNGIDNKLRESLSLLRAGMQRRCTPAADRLPRLGVDRCSGRFQQDIALLLQALEHLVQVVPELQQHVALAHLYQRPRLPRADGPARLAETVPRANESIS